LVIPLRPLSLKKATKAAHRNRSSRAPLIRRLWLPPRVASRISQLLRSLALWRSFLRTQSGCHRLIGKVYATDHRNVYQVMERLRQAAFDPEAEFSIPLPLAYFPSRRLLLQERVEGMSAKEIFEHGDERQCAAVAERSARWLVRFQTAAAPAGRISGIERFLSSAERKCRLISERDGLLASKCEPLLERLRAAAPSCDAISTCAGHGDYCEHQII